MDNYKIVEPQEIEEISDYFVEQCTSIRELQLIMYHVIGKTLTLKNASEEDIKGIAKDTKKHVGEFKSTIEFFKKYPDFKEFPFDKATSWIQVKRELGEGEKRPRKSLKKIIEERAIVHEVALNIGGEGLNRNYIQGKYDEDIELLKKEE